MSDNVKNNSLYKYIVGFIVVAVLGIIILFSLGYRFTENFRLAQNGYLSISVPLPETTIIINETKKIITSEENEVIEVSLPEKAHSIIVSHENFYPWIKEVKVSSNKTTEVSPIFVYQNPSGSIITKNDPEYWKIVSDINKNFAPNINSIKASPDESVNVWVENNTIMARVGGETVEVVKPENPVRNLDFYKNRNDSLIFSSGNGVFVIEINKMGTQNFMPIYKGERPTFVIGDENYIYIQDSQNLMQVII